MYYGFIKFNTIPKIGFAHHFYTDKQTYSSSYDNNRCIEIVYVNSGTIEAEFDGTKLYAPEGSIFVLFRKLPITLRVIGASTHSHSTVQLELSKTSKIIRDGEPIPENGALLPFVVMPSAECEQIKKDIYSVISILGASREQNSFSASLKAVGIIQKIDELTRKRLMSDTNEKSLLVIKAKNYIEENIYSPISLSDIARHIKKTPNYINSVFKSETGTTIIQYANRKKAEKIASLLIRKKYSFREACVKVSINDIQYGKKLFMKHIGVSAEVFARGSVHKHTI